MLRKLRLVILYDNENVVVEFNPDVFRELFKSYYNELLDIDKTFDKLEKELKDQTKKR